MRVPDPLKVLNITVMNRMFLGGCNIVVLIIPGDDHARNITVS